MFSNYHTWIHFCNIYILPLVWETWLIIKLGATAVSYNPCFILYFSIISHIVAPPGRDRKRWTGVHNYSASCVQVRQILLLLTYHRRQLFCATHTNLTIFGGAMLKHQVLSSSWDGRPFGHNRHGPKIGGCAPYGEAGSQGNTIWPVPRPVSLMGKLDPKETQSGLCRGPCPLWGSWIPR